MHSLLYSEDPVYSFVSVHPVSIVSVPREIGTFFPRTAKVAGGRFASDMLGEQFYKTTPEFGAGKREGFVTVTRLVTKERVVFETRSAEQENFHFSLESETPCWRLERQISSLSGISSQIVWKEQLSAHTFTRALSLYGWFQVKKWYFLSPSSPTPSPIHHVDRVPRSTRRPSAPCPDPWDSFPLEGAV